MGRGHHFGNGHLRRHGSTRGAEENAIAASLNRGTLRRNGVSSFNIVGGPGCGKTTLILQTIARMLPELRIGVIAANSTVNPDIERFTAMAHQVARLESGGETFLTAADIQRGLARLDLTKLGLVFIENISLLLGPSDYDLGEEKRVAVFSVAAGAHEAAKHPQVVRWADAIVLNKLDLLSVGSFDLQSFRADVERLHPRTPLFVLSASRGEGFDEWIAWVRKQTTNMRKRAGARRNGGASSK